jgi:hypothetical protein
VNKYIRIKLALSALGIVLLIVGMALNDPRIRWVAIAILAASVLMRLVPRRLRGEDYPAPPNPPPPTQQQ